LRLRREDVAVGKRGWHGGKFRFVMVEGLETSGARGHVLEFAAEWLGLFMAKCLGCEM